MNNTLSAAIDYSIKPVRLEGIEIQPWGNGHIVFDSVRDRLYRTSPTATLILLLCTGRNTISEIADLVKEAHHLPNAPTGIVSGAVSQMMDQRIVAPLAATRSTN